jgi:4-hydroxy-tetrahydrodipicolinate synthase
VAALLDTSARGVFAIAVTPFRDDGALDLDSTDSMVDFYLRCGVHGLTILGIMGEAPKLTSSESVSFARRVLARTAGRVPVVVGVSAPGFALMRELTDAVMAAGAAGVMVAPPTAAKTDGAVLTYFSQVTQTLPGVPFVLQDFPQSNGVQISAAVIRQIADTMPTCVMLKAEDWPGLAKITAVRTPAPSRRLSILVGNNAVFLPEELRRGADGAMTGFAFPEMMVDVVAAHEAGDLDRAGELHDAYLPLTRYEQQPNIGLAARKYLLAKRGAIASAALRLPRATLTPQDIDDVERLLARQERRLAALR